MTTPGNPEDTSQNIRLPAAVCAVVGEVLRGSHTALNDLFQRAGAPWPPPQRSHGSKWKEWLLRSGDDPSVDSLKVLGLVLEEFMDVPPKEGANIEQWQGDRQRVVDVLEESGLRYFRGGRVLPNLMQPQSNSVSSSTSTTVVRKPQSVQELLLPLIRGLPRAMHPLVHRRAGATALSFRSEYDLQDLLHALLRPWVADIRPEEFTPSYAGTSTRMDFLLPAHRMVLELKFVRDRSHGRKVGDELIVDIEHYRKHPACEVLWCVVYDPSHYVGNSAGLIDLEGTRSTRDGKVDVRVFVITA